MQAINDYRRIPYLIALLCGLYLCLIISTGCTSLTVTNKTADGREFRACATSFLWDRRLEGLQFDYEAGTLDVIDYASNPDKETIAKSLDVIASALELMKAAAK